MAARPWLAISFPTAPKTVVQGILCNQHDWRFFVLAHAIPGMSIPLRPLAH